MLIRVSHQNATARHAAFSLIEVMLAMGLVGIVIVSLYAGMSFGFSATQAARENLRATQIMVEKMETIRLYNWYQINQVDFDLPQSFTNFYDERASETNFSSINYVGRMTIAPCPGSYGVSYTNDMRLVTIHIRWTGANKVPQTREMQTLVSRHGLQNYIY